MLLRFSVENFLSFKDKVYFSLIPGRGSLKREHRSTPINGVSALKSSVIFGGNASGKSNLIKAIDFGRRMIVTGLNDGQNINYRKFRLNEDSLKKPSQIEYEIQTTKKNYAYGFVFDNENIIEEWLYEINKRSQKMIFERNSQKVDQYNLEPLLEKNSKEEDKQFIKFIAKGTPNNRLFLTEIHSRKVQDNVENVEDVIDVYKWFQNQLKIIFPSTKYKEGIQSELEDNNQLHTIYEELLRYFDTGINDVQLKTIKPEASNIPQELLNRIKGTLFNLKLEGVKSFLTSNRRGRKDTFIISKNDDDIVVKKFMTAHKRQDGSLEWFDTGDESDGTNRIIEFIPLIIDLLKGENVFFVDEVERSLHPNLIYDIFDLFLELASKKNCQLIATTHESSLLTQKLFRKDEIWFVVKNDFGESKVYSLEDYNVRFDKEIRKDYLLGRFKAIPRIGNREDLSIKNIS